jgi:hypothetical protein
MLYILVADIRVFEVGYSCTRQESGLAHVQLQVENLLFFLHRRIRAARRPIQSPDQ